MKFSFFNIIFVVSLACLFALQGIWLYYAYQNEKMKVHSILNNSLLQAIDDEMDRRFSLTGEKELENGEWEDDSDSIFEYRYDETKGNFISQQSDFIQQILFLERIFFELPKVDSIYDIYLRKNNIYVQYRLVYMDSLGNSIESIGADIDKGFNTRIVPVVNGTKVGAIVKIPPPAIFRNMLGILIVSVLIFFFIIACLIYEVNVFFTQNYLHQLWKNFVHVLSQDMKTPLATIHSVLTQLNNGSLDANPEMKSRFTTIAIDQTISLQTIIDQILTMAYTNRKKLTLNKQEIDLPQMIHSLINRFMVRKEKDIEFSEKYRLKSSLIYADPFYLGNAVSNLIDNAVKYSGDTVRIDIDCATEDEQVYIRIKDNGFGISEEDQEKIYDPFERGAEIKRKRIRGFGLGLSYVKYVIEAHGGSVAFVSMEGIGSEFTIIIPIRLT